MEINANYRKIRNLLRQHEQIYFNSIRNAKLMFVKLSLNVGVKPRRNLFMIPADLHPDKAMPVVRECNENLGRK